MPLENCWPNIEGTFTGELHPFYSGEKAEWGSISPRSPVEGCEETVFRAVSSLHPPLASRPAWHHVELEETHESLFDGALDHTHRAVAAQKAAVATFLFGSDDSAGKPSCPLW